jgi:hypothetical protein
MAMRFRIEARDVPPEMVARRLGKTLAEFEAVLGKLIARGFPAADPDTGNFDLHAIDRWCDREHRRQGLRCLTIELRETEIDTLIRRGLLKSKTRNIGRGPK